MPKRTPKKAVVQRERIMQAGESFVLRDGDIITVAKAETFRHLRQRAQSGQYVLQSAAKREKGDFFFFFFAVEGGLTERGTGRAA